MLSLFNAGIPHSFVIDINYQLEKFFLPEYNSNFSKNSIENSNFIDTVYIKTSNYKTKDQIKKSVKKNLKHKLHCY
jgi:hypothetical protein